MKHIVLGFALLAGLIVTNAAAAPGTFRFLTNSLPVGTTNENYNSRLVAANADGSVTFGLDGTSDPMPPGLTLDTATGFITGIPTASGNSSMVFTATDASQTITLTISLSINSAGGGGSPDVYLTTTSLPDGRVGSAYTTTLAAAGGTGPYIFIICGIPTGLSLDGETGELSGIPNQAGTFMTVMTVVDTNDDSKSSKLLPLTILPADSDFRFTSLIFDHGEVGSDYEDEYTTSGGASSVVFSASGLPAGLTLDPLTGIVTGTPTEDGTFSVQVEADDAIDTIVIEQDIIIAPTNTSQFYWDVVRLPSATQNVDYSDQPPITVAAVNGGTVTYAASGLPTGILYNTTTGELTGIPTGAVGVYPVTFTATDTTPNPDVVITLQTTFTVVDDGGGDTNNLGANFFVTKQKYKRVEAGRDSWAATIIYNDDRTTANRFDPATDDFEVSLGQRVISIPAGSFVVSSPVKYIYKSVAAVDNPMVYQVMILADKQQIKFKTSNDTLLDAVPNSLIGSLKLGSYEGRIEQYLDESGKFNIVNGYRNTGFVVAKAKLTKKGAGLDAAKLSLLLAAPSLSYATGDEVRIRLRDDLGNILFEKDVTALISGVTSVDSKTGVTLYTMKQTTADADATNILSGFKFSTKKGKMSIKLSALDLSLLTADQEELDVEVTINGVDYDTDVTLFDPKAVGSYSEKMPQ